MAIRSALTWPVRTLLGVLSAIVFGPAEDLDYVSTTAPTTPPPTYE